jgi:hypothetical protein
VAAGHRGNFALRALQVGATVLAIGVLIYFAARSPNGGLAGILLSGLLSWIAFITAFNVALGMWRASRWIEERHLILGGCLVTVAVCAIGGFLLIFGSQLLWGVMIGGLTAILNGSARLVTWQQLFGIDPTPAPAPEPGATTTTPRSVWAGPLPVTASIAVTLVCVVAGIFFAGLGTIRVLEASSNLVDFQCSPPCALVSSLWVNVVPYSDGQVVAQPDATTVEVQVSFSDDAPGDRVVRAADFSLTGQGSTYPHSLNGNGCDLWVIHLHIDEKSGVHALCFSIPSGATLNPDQLTLNWNVYGGPGLIPLCKTRAACVAAGMVSPSS